MSTSPSENEAALKVKANQAEAEGNTPVKTAAEKPKPQFWLVAKIQDCRVVTTQETASAKCYLKIHWQDPTFIDKIRAEQLVGRPSPNPNKGEMVNIELNMKLEKLAVDLENGELVYGMVDAAPDSFPVNINEIFLNQISSERIDSLCWTMYKKGVVSVQIVMKVTVHAPMSLQRYPYDRHIVPFCVGTRATKDVNGKKTKWKLSKEWPEWAPATYEEDKTMLLEDQTTMDLEYRHKRCFPYLGGDKPILCVRIERQPVNIMKRVALPVFIVVSLALSVSGIGESSYQDEYGAALTSLLTLTAFSYTVQSSLPKLPYLTLADCYFLLGYSLHLVIVLKILMASQVCLDTSDYSNRSFVLGDTVCQDRNHWLTTVLAIMWALLHVMLFLSIMLPLRVNKYVRKPYKKLIEEYAHKFFSKPVLCPMGEGSGIDELAKIDTDDQMKEKEEKKEKKAGEKGKKGSPTTSSSSSK